MSDRDRLAYQDGPNTHTYRGGSFVTAWTIVPLTSPDGDVHHFHVPSAILDEERAIGYEAGYKSAGVSLSERPPVEPLLTAIENLPSVRSRGIGGGYTVDLHEVKEAVRAALAAPAVPPEGLDVREDAYQSGLLDGEGFIREKYDLVPKGGVLAAVREAWAEWDSGLGAADEYIARKIARLSTEDPT